MAAAGLRKGSRKIFRGVLYGTADKFDQFGGAVPDQGQERLACLERLSSNEDYLTPKSSTAHTYTKLGTHNYWIHGLSFNIIMQWNYETMFQKFINLL